jgi:hypothetical protein
MKLEDIDSDNVKVTDLETMFSVYLDKRGNYALNLNEGLYLSFNQSNLPHVKLDHDLFWTTISYKIYGTTRLAWLLMKLNNVQASQIFDIQRTGTDIYYIPKESVNRLLREL